LECNLHTIKKTTTSYDCFNLFEKLFDETQSKRIIVGNKLTLLPLDYYRIDFNLYVASFVILKYNFFDYFIVIFFAKRYFMYNIKVVSNIL